MVEIFGKLSSCVYMELRKSWRKENKSFDTKPKKKGMLERIDGHNISQRIPWSSISLPLETVEKPREGG